MQLHIKFAVYALTNSAMNINTTRIETLSDGVVAIVITIMVLEFKLPAVDNKATSTLITEHLSS